MFFLGFSAGIFVIPLQVYIQKTSPPEQKGRVIGALNLLSWMGVSTSAVFVGLSNRVTDELAGDESSCRLRFLVFAALALALALVMLPGRSSSVWTPRQIRPLNSRGIRY